MFPLADLKLSLNPKPTITHALLSGFLGQTCLMTITAALMSIPSNKVAENKQNNDLLGRLSL